MDLLDLMGNGTPIELLPGIMHVYTLLKLFLFTHPRRYNIQLDQVTACR